MPKIPGLTSNSRSLPGVFQVNKIPGVFQVSQVSGNPETVMYHHYYAKFSQPNITNSCSTGARFNNQSAQNLTLARVAGASTQGGRMVRDAPWRKLGGNVVMIMMLLLVSIIIYYYMNTFITLHQCTFNVLFALFSTLCLKKKHPRCF